MAIGQNQGGGTWWKVLLGVLGGFILGVGSVVGGVAITGAVVKTGTLLGDNADKILSKEYQEKTILNIVMDAIGGKIKVETLGDLNNITPLVGEYVTGVKNSLNNIGCELTNEEMYTWSLSGLSDSVIGAVKGAKLIRVLSKDNIEYPKPIIKYLSYETYPEGSEHAGEYVLDEEGNLKHMTLSAMLDDSSYIQKKVDTMRIKMLFTEADIKASPLLTAIQDKSVTQLKQAGAFNDVEISAVITITPSSPKILKTFVANKVTIGGMGDAINNLYLDEVVDISSTSSPVMKKLFGVSNATTELPNGPKFTSAPYNVTRIELDGLKVTTQYDKIVISDGTNKSKAIPFDEILIRNPEAPGAAGYLDGYQNITIDEAGNYTLSDNISRLDDDKAAKEYHTNVVTINNITVPATWGSDLYILSCNERTKVNELSKTIDDLKFRDAMSISISDALWRVRDKKITTPNIIDELYIDDVLENRNTMKFLKALPTNTKVTGIGTAVNNLQLIKAFEDEIYDGTGDSARINPKWKYLLASSKTELNGLQDPLDPTKTKTKGSNPFAGYACEEYKVGGDSTHGINQLITNMTNNMTTASVKALHTDGVITLTDTAILTKAIPTAIKTAYPDDTAGCTYYGDMSFVAFVKIAGAYVPTE